MAQDTTEEVANDSDAPNPYSPTTADEFDTYMSQLVQDCLENGLDADELLDVLDDHVGVLMAIEEYGGLEQASEGLRELLKEKQDEQSRRKGEEA